MLSGDIAIIGFGAIGQRHLESCLNGAGESAVFHIVTKFHDHRQSAADVNSSALAAGQIIWHSEIDSLPRDIDVAIIATRADTRAEVVRQLLDATSVRRLLLEKVLFQKLADYSATEEVLRASDARAWVNCARRCWAGYRDLRIWLHGKKIVDLSVSGDRWDIGCNAIHFLDLLAYLSGTTQIDVTSVGIARAVPARRSGMLQIDGCIAGNVNIAGVMSPYCLTSGAGEQKTRAIEIQSDAGPVRCVESADTLTVLYPDGIREETPIPRQSQLTAGIVEAMIEPPHDRALASYAESRALHEPLIGGLLDALEARSLVAEAGRCPVT